MEAKRGFSLSGEMLKGISALLVSRVAVVISLYSAWIDRAHARVSVWPTGKLISLSTTSVLTK